MNKLILINNVYSYRNRGDSAIVESMAHWFQENVPGAEIYLLSQHWKENSKYYEQFGWHSAPMLWDIPMNKNKLARAIVAGWELCRTGVRLIFKRRRRSPCDTSWLYRNCDLIVDAGGGAIYSSNRYRFYLGLYQHLFNLYAGVLLRKVVTIAPQSIGPLYRRQDVVAVRAVLRRLDRIYVRERVSEKVLAGVGVKCELAPDCAFLGGFVREEGAALNELIETIRKKDGLKIGLTVLNWMWAAPVEIRLGGGMEDYLGKIGRALAEICREEKVQVYLFSHADVGDAVSDYKVSLEMAGILERNGVGVEVLSSDHTASDLFHLYGEMDVMLGSRMHSCILALMANTPVVALAYQPKTTGVLSCCGLGEFVMDAYAFGVEELVGMIKTCLRERDTLRRSIKACVDRERAAANSAFFRMMDES